VKCWGYNGDGELGNGASGDRSTPVGVVGLSSGVTALSFDFEHVCALTSAGKVKCWGLNDRSQLGDGTTISRSAPVDVVGVSGATAVAAGQSHSCALTSGGVKCWGANDNGQLGDSTTTSRPTPVSVTGLGTGVTALSAGDFHTCAVTSGAGVTCWGLNASGQLGDNTTTDRSSPVAVTGLGAGLAVVLSSGGSSNCVVTSGGGAKCWGDNAYGSLGDGTSTNRPTPVAATGLTSGVIAISAGWEHSCAVTTGGRAMCWGANDYGELGDRTTNARLVPGEVYGILGN
jgi:alpha-tubulin suppressor-like RCC1 family protein